MTAGHHRGQLPSPPASFPTCSHSCQPDLEQHNGADTSPSSHFESPWGTELHHPEHTAGTRVGDLHASHAAPCSSSEASLTVWHKHEAGTGQVEAPIARTRQLLWQERPGHSGLLGPGGEKGAAAGPIPARWGLQRRQPLRAA